MSAQAEGAPSKQPDAALELRDLTKIYQGGIRAVDSLSLRVEEGSFFGLLGPNGAGKSTIIRMICGLVRVTSGNAWVFGHDCVRDPVGARRLVGLSPQEANLDRFLTVRETLVYHGGYFGVPRAQARVKADELIDTFDLGSKANVRTPRLSGGMKRRLLLAKAFMHEPPFIVLDEPTAGVDVELRHELWTYIRKLHQMGRTILLTTHYLEEADVLCDDIALIRDGRIVARDTPGQLKRNFDASSLEEVYLRVMNG